MDAALHHHCQMETSTAKPRRANTPQLHHVYEQAYLGQFANTSNKRIARLYGSTSSTPIHVSQTISCDTATKAAAVGVTQPRVLFSNIALSLASYFGTLVTILWSWIVVPIFKVIFYASLCVGSVFLLYQVYSTIASDVAGHNNNVLQHATNLSLRDRADKAVTKARRTYTYFRWHPIKDELFNRYRTLGRLLGNKIPHLFLLVPALLTLQSIRGLLPKRTWTPWTELDALNVPWYMQITRREVGSNHLGDWSPSSLKFDVEGLHFQTHSQLSTIPLYDGNTYYSTETFELTSTLHNDLGLHSPETIPTTEFATLTERSESIQSLHNATMSCTLETGTSTQLLTVRETVELTVALSHRPLSRSLETATSTAPSTVTETLERTATVYEELAHYSLQPVTSTKYTETTELTATLADSVVSTVFAYHAADKDQVSESPSSDSAWPGETIRIRRLVGDSNTFCKSCAQSHCCEVPYPASAADE